MRGIYGKNLSLDFLWNSMYGPPIFRKHMSRNRFKVILKFLRFDVKSERSMKPVSDKFGIIRDVFENFRENILSIFVPYSDLTIDEQLLPLKTRCGFINFMPNKPDKYGLRLVQPLQGKGYNICTDNFFTSVALARRLLKAKTSIVGTMRKNRKEIFPALTKKKALYDTEFLLKKRQIL
jgi:hypothetical protein